ncbi:MAG: hypothetical protein CVV02_02225 [Firmicutes bacterium HGW-Firmicutes-7]|nr:MAG: hypothetical protein CVV02_02225 [Firmicutes bacterium HGW-Firmicutes-7]
MKKIIVFVLLFLFCMGFAVNAQDSINVVIDGETVIFTDAVPFIDENNRTLVPLRAIGEAMGLAVEWDPIESAAIFSKEYTWENSPLYQDDNYDGIYDTYVGYEKVRFIIGSNTAIYDVGWYDKESSVKENNPVSGGYAEIKMDTAAINKDSRVYAPVRYLANIFRFDVAWDNITKLVALNQLTTTYQLGIRTELVAGWENYQGWIMTAEKDTEVASVEIIEININDNSVDYSELTEEEKQTIYDTYDETLNIYLTGFLVNNKLENNTSYDYSIRLLVNMKDGTQKNVILDINLYYNGDQGGIL